MRRVLAVLCFTMTLSAQAPTDASFYAVAYVDVMPASKATVVNAFKAYRDASSKESGFVRFEIFEQPARPGHFAIIESWSNPQSFDMHAAVAHTKEWRMKLDPIRTSDYDQRPYKTLSLGPTASASTNGATYVISHVDIGGQGTNAADLLKRQAEASRKDSGNLRFDVLQHAMRANHFTVIEAWQNPKAAESHAAAEHSRQYRDALGPIAGSPLDERIYEVAK